MRQVHITKDNQEKVIELQTVMRKKGKIMSSNEIINDLVDDVVDVWLERWDRTEPINIRIK